MASSNNLSLGSRSTLILAFDSFKGSLTARQACEAAARGLASARPDLDLKLIPLADGGEGTAETLMASRSGTWITLEAAGPLPDTTVSTRYAWLEHDGPTALIEMSLVNGLTLLAPAHRDVMRASTRRTGEHVADAVRRGARTIWLTLGGSATVDGGTGAARALGWRFVDATGRDVPEGGAGLEQIAHVLPPAVDALSNVEMKVLCDVDNPLLGPRGAARVFGPQKGASPTQVERLERGLAHLAQIVKHDLGIKLHDLSGAGAAGGLGWAAVVFLGGRLISGIELILQETRFDHALKSASGVITGEGRLDRQSLHGKVISGVLSRASTQGVPVAVIAGRCELDLKTLQKAGISAVEVLQAPNMSEIEALAHAEELLEAAANRVIRHLDTPPEVSGLTV